MQVQCGPFIPAKSVGFFFAGDAHGGWGSLEAGLQLGFCHPNIMGLLCFSEVCRIRHRTIHRWMKYFMIWSDFTSWEFETSQKSEQNVSMGRILYRGLVAFLSKAKIHHRCGWPRAVHDWQHFCDLPISACCLNPKTLKWKCPRHGDCGFHHTLRYRVRAVCLESNMQDVLLG